MYPNEILAGSIYVYHDTLDDPMRCIRILDELQPEHPTLQWNQATTEGGHVSSYRSNDCVNISVAHDQDLPGLAMEDARIYHAITDRLRYYAAEHDIAPMVNEGWNVLKYNAGTEYLSHHDYHHTNQRIVSSVLYLNDDFLGGETEFVKFGVSVKPRAGTLILFPSNYAYRHVARPLLSGTKYAIVSWFRE